jgi:hypothetical protein
MVCFFQGVLLGMSNTAGVLAGVIGTAATGYTLQHGMFKPKHMHTWRNNKGHLVNDGVQISGTLLDA